MSWINKLIFIMISELLMSLLETLAQYINNIFDVMYELQDLSSLDGVRTYITTISISLVAVYALKYMIDTYVLMNNGDLDQEPLDIIVRCAETVATILCGSFVIEQLLAFASTLASEVTESQFSDAPTLADKLQTLLDPLSLVDDISSCVLLLLGAGLVIGLIIYVIKAAKRGAELILFQMILPLIALNKLGSSRDIWKNFTQDLMICIFGYIIQIFGFNEFIRILGNYPVGGTNVLVAAFAWILVTIKAPKWIEKFISHTGAGAMVGRGGMMGMKAIVQIAMKK